MLVKFSKNIDFCQIWQKSFLSNFSTISILVKFSEKFQFLDKIFENFIKFDFSNNLDFFSEISKNFDICQVFEKISLSVQIFENFSKIWKKFDFVKFSTKFQFWTKLAKISKNVDFCQIFEKNSILAKFPKNFDFGQIFWKNLILVKFSKNFWD